MNTTQNTVPKKSSGKKWLFIGLGVITTGVLSFFGYQYWKSNKKENEKPGGDAPDFKAEKPKTVPKKKPPVKKPVPKSAPKPSTNTSANTNTTFPDYFPLRKGSQGERVKILQGALIRKYGKTILPKGATGIYDSDLQAALKKQSLPESIDETTFNVLTHQTKVEPGMIARGLQVAIKAKSFTAALKILKAIKSPLDYTAVNKVFSTYLINGVRQTIVNAILGAFKDEKQKQEIRLALAAMGLKYDGKKWTLSGLDGKPFLITTHTTKVWKDPRTSVVVPKNMVLGREIEQRKNFTLFENDKQFFLVESKHVNPYRK